MIKHFLTLEELSTQEILALLERAQYFHKTQNIHNNLLLQNKIVANVFFEPSTRTRSSFEIAAKKLGAHVINFSPENSSVKKGETIYDTLKTLESLGANCLVVRHADDHIFDGLQNKFQIPLINAGAGKFEHPSQGLLDLLTLSQEFKTLKGLNIAICGDILHSRVAGSLMVLAKKFEMNLFVCGPEALLPTKLPASAKKAKLDEVISKIDVLMLLRVQLERHEGLDLDAKNYLKDFGLNTERIKKLSPKAIIMHPGPFNRGIEIDDSLIEHSQSRIFKQMSNGVFARMSILETMLGQDIK